jgi:hypothetical protein
MRSLLPSAYASSWRTPTACSACVRTGQRVNVSGLVKCHDTVRGLQLPRTVQVVSTAGSHGLWHRLDSELAAIVARTQSARPAVPQAGRGSDQR